MKCLEQTGLQEWKDYIFRVKNGKIKVHRFYTVKNGENFKCVSTDAEGKFSLVIEL